MHTAAPLSLIEDLLREPARCAARLTGEEPGADITPLYRTLIATIVLGAGVFGAVLGAFRGGRQIFYCAVKVPLLLLLTLVICAPPMIAIVRVAGPRPSARGVVGLTLGACARFALVLAGLAPVLWLLCGVLHYHSVILATVVSCAVAGGAAAGLLYSGLVPAAETEGGSRRLLGVAFVLIFALVGAHTSWLLRPFLVRPRTVEVPFLRSIEGDLLGAMHKSVRSAAGVYDGPGSAP